jgi:hypothetical protein
MEPHMNRKRALGLLLPRAGCVRVPWRGFLPIALLLLSVSCAGPGPAATPVLQVFDSPASETNTFADLTLLSPDDPTHAHWVGHFAASVDLDGDVLVAGEPYWGRPPGESDGAAYVYRRSPAGEWQLEATLAASDRDDGVQRDQHFGGSVALQGTVLAVGAPGYDDPQAGDDIGAVHIFEYAGGVWLETAKLVPGLRTPGAELGKHLALDGDLLAVSGSPLAGSVSTFQREAGGWRETASVPVPPSRDGEPTYVLIDLYGDTLAASTIAMYSLDEQDYETWVKSLTRTEVVALYERTGDRWQRTFQTPPQEVAMLEMEEWTYGLPVSLGGEGGKASLLAVGKPGFPQSGRETGSVAIYERGDHGWRPQAELSLAPGEQVPGAMIMLSLEPDAAFFGASVKLEGSRLAVVSFFANAAYVFDRQGSDWIYRFRVSPGPTYGDDFQSRTVAMSGHDLLLGSPGELGGGHAFVFDLSP